MTTQPFTLDKWDIALIRLLKGKSRPTSLQLCALWAERCFLDSDYPGLLNQVILRMAKIVEATHPFTLPDLIEAANPSNAWQYGDAAPGDYWGAWFNVLRSRIRLTEVVKLPGYREALDAEKEPARAAGRASVMR